MPTTDPLLRENLDESYYTRLIGKFVSDGETPDQYTGDPICDYLVTVMQDAQLRLAVLTDPVRARIFQDQMMRFVDSALRRKRFNFQRRQAERQGVEAALDWSLDKKQDGHQALVEQLGKEYEPYGFRSAFYRREMQQPGGLGRQELWESMHKDYLEALNEMLRNQTRQLVEQDGPKAKERMRQLLTTVPDYLQRHVIEEDTFHQAWGMLGGEWNEYDFQRFVRIARLQQEYPVLLELASRMGRTPDPNGQTAMWVGSGNAQPLDHSSRSDILGITTGQELDGLLPLELAQMADDDLSDLFLVKYTTSKLQNFQHKSEQLSPNKRLERRRARQKGPMIVCVDTSGSMVGVPHQIVRSLTLKLVEMARRQHRDLFLIAFSVSARPIDAGRERVKLLDFFSRESTGDTSPQKMMQLVLQVLDQKPEYMGADVALISDFRMPLATQPVMDRLHLHRQTGTAFYGLQIGANPQNHWLSHLDHLYQIGYTPSRRY